MSYCSVSLRLVAWRGPGTALAEHSAETQIETRNHKGDT